MPSFVYEPDDEDALGQLPGPLSQGVCFVVAIERAMLVTRNKQMTHREHITLGRKNKIKKQNTTILHTLAGSKSGG